MDDRAQAIGIFRFFMSLSVGAVVFWIVLMVTDPALELAGGQGSDPVSADGTSYMSTAVEYIPILFLGVAFFGLIALAVYRREVLR